MQGGGSEEFVLVLAGGFREVCAEGPCGPRGVPSSMGEGLLGPEVAPGQLVWPVHGRGHTP